MGLKDRRLFVNEKGLYWKEGDGGRRGGVRCLGMGGRKGDMMIEEGLERKKKGGCNEKEVVVLCGKRDSGLGEMREGLKEYVMQDGEVPVEDIAYTLG